MELVEVTVRGVQRRAGSVWVPWAELAAQQRRRGERLRSLAPGEEVVLQLDDRTTQRGWVLRNAHERTDGAYVIVVGDALARRVPVGGARPGVPLPR
jgi:hypothetical protein